MAGAAMMRHSPKCPAYVKDREPRCECDHPRCLHRKLSEGYFPAPRRSEPCRSKGCECERWTEEGAQEVRR